MAATASAAASSNEAMTDYTDADRTMALAGVFQAACLARDSARQGSCDGAAFAASRDSLFNFDPGSVAEVFGGMAGVARGLHCLLRQIDQPQQRDLEVSRYVVSLLHLSDLLRRTPQNNEALGEELAALARRHKHFALGDGILNEQLAEIYQSRISGLGPRIMVRGEPLHLQNPDNAARVRVALLAGIRAAVLWRQAGGKKWHFLLRRRRTALAARELLDRIGAEEPLRSQAPDD
jgi:high frequency lysogenization protein